MADSRRLDARALAEEVLAGDRTAIGRAITRVESQHARDADDAQALLERLLPHAGGARRVGITGVPGVGKSTLIEALGLDLIAGGHRVAVLAVDPSSTISGGSVMGDRTRMTKLSREANAFIRPSPSAGSLGGVTQRTRESMIVCEAAGFDVVLVETVGVGQSEAFVAEMVDAFMVLVLPGSGDELQGIKRGILELAHVIAVNKADGDVQAAAERTRQAHESAMQLMREAVEGWKTPVVTVSALEGLGVRELWAEIERFFAHLEANELLESRRRAQAVAWMWSAVDEALGRALRTDAATRALVPELERDVEAGTVTAQAAARRLLDAFGGRGG